VHRGPRVQVVPLAEVEELLEVSRSGLPKRPTYTPLGLVIVTNWQLRFVVFNLCVARSVTIASVKLSYRSDRTFELLHNDFDSMIASQFEYD
jgi:hypothetical protein